MVQSVSLYEAPALHVDPEELHKLLTEVKRVDALISGRSAPPQASLSPPCSCLHVMQFAPAMFSHFTISRDTTHCIKEMKQVAPR